MTSRTILIVDDNPSNMKLVSFLLTAKGYSVRTAASALEAIDSIKEQVPQLILMDLQMPQMDGLTLTRKLRSEPATQHVPIVAVTAYAMKGDERRAIEAGCDGYITKPIDTRALPGQLERFFRDPAEDS